ncbi:unnamed protein product [Peronospora effusa]|nr:unnamed protein product [Peronospora effusa]
MWSRDLKMGKHLLPVYADLLYRLQHNALFLGYRLQHLPGTLTLCHHGCGTLETAPHLFWNCEFAIQLWTTWLEKFQPLFTSPIEWNSVLLFIIEPTLDAKTLYGYSLFAVFHIVRAVIFRCLWMHRNDIRFHDLQPNIYDVQAKVLAVVNLHTEWFHRDLLDRSISHSSITLRRLHTLLEYMGLQQFRPPDPNTTAIAPD